jgi:hypothetical protein
MALAVQGAVKVRAKFSSNAAVILDLRTAESFDLPLVDSPSVSVPATHR